MSKRAIVTLVHGTWGRGFFPDRHPGNSIRRPPIWAEPGSSFYSELHHSLQEAGYDPDIVTFPWSGANSFVERDQTARALAELLDKQAAVTPNARQIVIGHSHGGNIVLSAARNYRQSSNPIHLITLATPFLEVISDIEKSPTRNFDSERRYNAALKFKIGEIILLSLAAGTSVFVVLGKVGFFDLSSQSGIYAICIYTFVASLISAIIFITLNTVFGKSETALGSVAMFDTPPGPGASSIRLLVLRGADDEASLALAAGSINRLITETFAKIVFKPLFRLSLYTVLLFCLVVWLLLAKSTFLFYFVAGLIMLYLLISGAKAVSASAFGREFLIGGVMIRVYSNSAPDSVCDMQILTLLGQIKEMYHKTDNNRGSGFWKSAQSSIHLRHSLYENKECIPSILAWLTAEIPHGEHEP